MFYELLKHIELLSRPEAFWLMGVGVENSCQYLSARARAGKEVAMGRVGTKGGEEKGGRSAGEEFLGATMDQEGEIMISVDFPKGA